MRIWQVSGGNGVGGRQFEGLFDTLPEESLPRRDRYESGTARVNRKSTARAFQGTEICWFGDRREKEKQLVRFRWIGKDDKGRAVC